MEDPSRVYTISNSHPAQVNQNNGNGHPSAATEQANGRNTAKRFNFVNIKSNRSIFKRNDFYKRISVILCLLILFLLIGFIVMIVKCKRKPVLKLCESNECLRSSANFKFSMDLSVDPCEDFYKYTCGKWSDEHPNHGWYPTFSAFRVIDERVAISALKFLQSNGSEDEPGPVQGARNLFKSCLDRKSVDKLGFTVIHNYLKKVGLKVVPDYLKDGSNDNEYKFNWVLFAARIKRVFSMDLAFNFAIDADLYNRSNNVVYLSSDLGDSPLPSPFKAKKLKKRFLLSEVDDVESSQNNTTSYVENEDAANIEKEESRKSGVKIAMAEIIKEVVKNSSESLDIADEVLNTAVDLLWNITDEILDIMNENDTEIDDVDIQKYKIGEFQHITDEYLQRKNIQSVDVWRPYLEELFKNSTSTFDFENDHIYMLKSEVPEILQLVAHMSEQMDIHLEMFFWWKIVESMIAGTTSDINEFVYKHTNLEYFVYPDVARSRSLECAQLVSAYMGVAVAYGIADTNFVNSTLPEVESMLQYIKASFEDNVWKMDWMDRQTKQAAIDKSREMIALIGFPDWLKNKSAIEVYYAHIVLAPDTFLENLMSIIQTYVPDMMDTYNEINYKQWRTDPVVVNAFHYVADNSINVPMAILTFPIYHLGLEVLNYGAIGAILGHELTHGFDNLGRNYDKVGNKIEWWTNGTAKTFEDKTTCFIDQYNHFDYPDLNLTVNGRDTLGENLADNGGLHQAYKAYQMYVKEHGPEKILPGFEDFTIDEMFFIAYGSIWCETVDIYSLEDQLLNDEHSPSYCRVTGSLQNSEEFASAFNCPKGSKMNPNKEKCRIW